MDDLIVQQPSVSRIFSVVELPVMDSKAAQEFFERTFAAVGHKGKEGAFEIMGVWAGGFPEGARLGGEDFLLAERVATLGPCLYAPDAVVYHRPRGRLRAVFRWFMRRGESEIMLLHATMARGSFRWYVLLSSWTMRLLLLMALLARWPQLAILLPLAGILYYGLILWRFRFARAYPSHRRAWWLVPIVKVTMDLGAELGRWKGLLSRGRQ
jgi:hypothetical protein